MKRTCQLIKLGQWSEEGTMPKRISAVTDPLFYFKLPPRTANNDRYNCSYLHH